MGPVLALDCFTRAGLLESVLTGTELSIAQRILLLDAVLPREWEEFDHRQDRVSAQTAWRTPERTMLLRAWMDHSTRRLLIRVVTA